MRKVRRQAPRVAGPCLPQRTPRLEVDVAYGA